MIKTAFAVYLQFVSCILPAVFAQENKKQLTVDEIFGSSKFALKSLSSVQWVDGGKKFSYLEVDSITKFRNVYTYTVADGKRELVIDGSLLVGKNLDTLDQSPPFESREPISIGSYAWSSDGERISVTGTLPSRGQKTGGNFGVFDVASKRFQLLTDTAANQAIVKLSPDGRRVGFLRENNLYVIDIETLRETQLTFDGSQDILNGRFDWVYEEEFSIIDGWQWSPDGRRIAFWRLDQTDVPAYPIVRYPADEPHGRLEMMRYPKAGDLNSLVKIGVINLDTTETWWLDLGGNTDIYIPRIQWTKDPAFLAVQRLNRSQDTLELLIANVERGTIKTILTETSEAWVDVNNNLTFLGRSGQFLWTSNRDGYEHIYLYSLDGTLVRQVTRGEWEATDIVGVNERRRVVYFIGTEASPLERHLYSIKLDGTGLRRMTRQSGWHSINFSPDYLVYIDTYSSVRIPTTISLHTNDGTRIARLVENTLDVLKDYQMGDQEFFSFKTTDGVSLNASMIKPVHLSRRTGSAPEADTSKKHPVLMYVYGGPGSQTVTNRWGGSRYLWHQLLVQHEYIVVSVDNRGTGARGREFMQMTHKRLGLRETDDIIETAKYLRTLPYVDSSRIGIWGWSGGGYMTCMAITLGADYFKTGIAVAPVTDLRFYDTIWTERYMEKPEENPEGYKESSPITHASKFKGNLLIIHGTADDNVHWQNTIVFVNELIKQNKQVQTMFYPDRTHGISSSNAARHLYTLMMNYLLEKL